MAGKCTFFIDAVCRLTVVVFMAPGAKCFFLSLLSLLGSCKFILIRIHLRETFLKTSCVIINTQIWVIYHTQMENIWSAKGGCENKYLTCTNKSQSSLTSVPESWAGAKTTILWRVWDSTTGAVSLFGMHKHPRCGLDVSARRRCSGTCMFSGDVNINTVTFLLHWPLSSLQDGWIQETV